MSNHIYRVFFFLVFFGSFSGMVFSQATIRGFVKDKETGEPVIYANVVLTGTTMGVSTDVNGYYSITRIPAGAYTLMVTSLEYAEETMEFVVEGKKVYSHNFLLGKGTIELEGAEIRADGDEQTSQVRVSVETIRPQDVSKVPSFGGTADLVQVMVTLPGFISTGDQGGQLYIRGGTPIQNLVLLDGMVIYNAFHSIGLFSVFDTDIIKNADIYTGGFGAQFGGRISSVMDITTRDGNKKKFSGKIGASTFGAKMMIEGPLKKLGENGGGISYVLSAKKSYLEESSQVFYKYIDDEGLPFNFQDIYGKVSFGSGSGTKLNVYGFDFRDQVKYQSISDLNWRNAGFGANFVIVPAGSPMLIMGNFANSNYNITLKEENNQDRFSEIGGFNFGLDFKYAIDDDELKYGISAIGYRTNYETFNALGVKINQEENTTELGVYGTYKWSHKRWLVEPGLRIQNYSSASTTSIEPRLGVKFKASERLRLKAAAGKYSQNLISANSDRDVVNLFYGFLSAPENLQKEFTKPNGNVTSVNDPLQKANHLILGFEFDLTEKWNINVEGYLKDFKQLTNTNRNKLFPDNAENADRPDALKKDFIVESGVAQGLDFVLKYQDKSTYIWLVYSIANVDRWDGFRWYDPVFDRTHNVNFVASQSFGEKDSWEASLRWNLGSGLPFTQTQGYYQPFVGEDGVASDYVAVNSNEMGIFYAELNEGRLPAYHRLDFSISKSWEFKDDKALKANFSITNIYSRKNVFYIDRVTGERINQLPFMPAIGFDYSF